MSVHAGSILHVSGNAVIDRVQSAGLGDVRLPIETIREVGNRLVVDKVPGEPDFTFTLESLDVSTEIMAFLTGKVGAGLASGQAPGFSDAAGTEYRWDDCQYVNITSPWKDPSTGSAGTVQAGHIVPGYYPTRLRYRFGVTDNATQEVELAGGSFFYSEHAPVEEFATANGSTTAFVTSENPVGYRQGGAGGTSFRYVFGVVVGDTLQTEGVDYTVSGASGLTPGGPATITFVDAPANGVKVRFCYFTQSAKAFPQTVHASTITKPGAVRGRNIQVYVGSGASAVRMAGVQSFELEATVEGDVEREMGSEDIVGRSVTGYDTTGTITIRSKDIDAFFNLLEQVTGLGSGEVYGWFNQHTLPVEVRIQDPKNPANLLKTIYIEDGIFQPPGTPARVNSPTDFSIRFDSQSGTFSEYKGARP